MRFKKFVSFTFAYIFESSYLRVFLKTKQNLEKNL